MQVYICHSDELHIKWFLHTNEPSCKVTFNVDCSELDLLLHSGNDCRHRGHQGDRCLFLPRRSRKILHHRHSGTFTCTLHDLMDDPGEDSLENGIIMVLWFDPHVILCSNMAHDGSQHVCLYSRCLWKWYFGISHTCKSPAYTAERRYGWLRSSKTHLSVQQNLYLRVQRVKLCAILCWHKGGTDLVYNAFRQQIYIKPPTNSHPQWLFEFRWIKRWTDKMKKTDAERLMKKKQKLLRILSRGTRD